MTDTSDVVQRARQALDGITEGSWTFYEDVWMSDVQVHRIGSLFANRDVALVQHADDEDTANARFIAAAPDLVTDLLALVEVALPTITAQRDDALAEVEKLRERKTNVARAGGYLAGVAKRERDEAIAERDRLRATIERVTDEVQFLNARDQILIRAALDQGKP